MYSSPSCISGGWSLFSAAFSNKLLRGNSKRNKGFWNKENALIREEQNLPSAPSYRWEHFLLFNECVCILCSRWNLWTKSAQRQWKSMNLHQFAQLKSWPSAFPSLSLCKYCSDSCLLNNRVYLLTYQDRRWTDDMGGIFPTVYSPLFGLAFWKCGIKTTETCAFQAVKAAS